MASTNIPSHELASSPTSAEPARPAPTPSSDRYSTSSADLRQARLQYVGDRWKGLADQLVVRLDALVAFLMVANAGGAVAILSFMGAMKNASPIAGAPLVLGLFLVGLVMVGVLRFIHYYRIAWLFAEWRDDANGFFGDRLDWNELLGRDRDRGRRFWLADAAGLISFGCFAAGIYIGYRGVLEMGAF